MRSNRQGKSTRKAVDSKRAAPPGYHKVTKSMVRGFAAGKYGDPSRGRTADYKQGYRSGRAYYNANFKPLGKRGHQMAQSMKGKVR